jgi:hypothetical protein
MRGTDAGLAIAHPWVTHPVDPDWHHGLLVQHSFSIPAELTAMSSFAAMRWPWKQSFGGRRVRPTSENSLDAGKSKLWLCHDEAQS